MATKIQVRRDTPSNWTSANPVLGAGEIGLETGIVNGVRVPTKWKIGDGTRTWQELTYQFPILVGDSGQTPDGTTLVVDQTNDRVGIGTATPAQKLDVVGTAAISGNTTIGGTLSAGATTLSGDLAVNAATNADITTTTSTATVFNTNATTLNIGGAATAVGIGAATGTTTINNATTAIAGAATVGGTLAVTGNTTLTGDLAVNGGDITTNQTTATVFNTNATTINVGQAATTVSIGATTGTATIRNATTAITGAATVGGNLTVSGTANIPTANITGGTISSLATPLPIASGGTATTTANGIRSLFWTNGATTSSGTHTYGNTTQNYIFTLSLSVGQIEIHTVTYSFNSTSFTPRISVTSSGGLYLCFTEGVWNGSPSTINGFGPASSLHGGSSSSQYTIIAEGRGAAIGQSGSTRIVALRIA